MAKMVIAANANAVLGQLNERLEALEQFQATSGTLRAKWIEIYNDVCTLHAAPFVAAELAHNMLWKQTRGG
jgi:hypothetical protein